MKEYKEGNQTVINGDFLEVDIPDQSIDLTVTSPPYNLNKDYDGGDDLLPYEDYLEWSWKWLDKLSWVTSDTGRLCLNIPPDIYNYDERKHRGERLPLSVDLIRIAQDIGWNYKVCVSWNKENVHRRTAWGSWLSASAPNINNPVENIFVLYKGEWKRNKKGESTITKEEFIDLTLGIWTFQGQGSWTRAETHPAPYPVELPSRCIKLFSYKDDLIFDPFLGSGSTLIAAKNLGRKGLGTEISKKYTALSINRLRTNKSNDITVKSIETFIT